MTVSSLVAITRTSTELELALTTSPFDPFALGSSSTASHRSLAQVRVRTSAACSPIPPVNTMQSSPCKTIDVISADDEAAVKRVLKMVDGHDVELWHHERKFVMFNGER